MLVGLLLAFPSICLTIIIMCSALQDDEDKADDEERRSDPLPKKFRSKDFEDRNLSVLHDIVRKLILFFIFLSFHSKCVAKYSKNVGNTYSH